MEKCMRQKPPIVLNTMDHLVSDKPATKGADAG